MAQRFSGQTAVITGGAGGIGLAIAARLGSEGATVVLLDLAKPAALDAARDGLRAQGVDAHAWRCDVTSAASVDGALARAHALRQRLDVVVNSAGVTGKTNTPTHEADPRNVDFVFRVNFTGTFLMCRGALKYMLPARYGRLVNIASIAGKEGNAGMMAYSASKAAVVGLTKVVGKEYADTAQFGSITCNAIAPAVVRTPMVAAMPPAQVKYMTDKIPMRRTGELDEIAALAAFVASKEASFTTAFTFDATGGRATY